MVPVAAAVRQAFEFSRALRENVLNVSGRFAAQSLAAETNARRVFDTLDAALRQALEATADYLERQGHPELAAVMSPTIAAAIEGGS